MLDAVTRRFQPGVLTSQKVKVKRDPRDSGFLVMAAAGVVVLVAVAFVFLWSRLTVVNLGYEISAANSKRASLIEKNKRLRVEYMRLKSPERIERMATEMGLVYPGRDQIVEVR